MRIRSIVAYVHDCRGTTAVEFAIVGPVMMMFIIGIFYIGLLLFSFGSLYFAVEDAARCASIKTAVCPDSEATVAYARSHFYSLGIMTPHFAAGTAACGHSVTATTSFVLEYAAGRITVPMTAAACYP